MPTVNRYFTQGTSSEQNLVEDLIVESLSIYGEELFYIPRTLVNKDEILGEDRLSEFNCLFPIEMYFENVEQFEGQGAFIQKFGLMMEQSATLVVAKRRWDELIGQYDATIIPSRPCEGDLIYFPLTKGLFEIRFVDHDSPFYQIGKLYVYKLSVEQFQYSSEHIDTGLHEVDGFERDKTFQDRGIIAIQLTATGSGYETCDVIITDPTGAGIGATAIAFCEDGQVVRVEMTSVGYGYSNETTVTLQGGANNATAVAIINDNIDEVESYGDNNKFLEESDDVIFDVDNPFGDPTC